MARGGDVTTGATVTPAETVTVAAGSVAHGSEVLGSENSLAPEINVSGGVLVETSWAASSKPGGVSVGVFVGVSVGVGVGVSVGVLVGVSVAVGVGVSVGVLVGVFVGVSVGVFVGVSVGVLVGVSVGVLVGVLVGVSVGVFVGVSVDVLGGVSVGVFVGVSVAPIGVSLGTSVAGRRVFVGVVGGRRVGMIVSQRDRAADPDDSLLGALIWTSAAPGARDEALPADRIRKLSQTPMKAKTRARPDAAVSFGMGTLDDRHAMNRARPKRTEPHDPARARI